MLEYKFRGWKKDNSGWVYGELHLLSPVPHIHDVRSGKNVPIFPESVDLFTHEYSKDKQEIYGGDIVEYNGVRDYVVRFNEGAWGIHSESIVDTQLLHDCANKVVILGDTFNNPMGEK